MENLLPQTIANRCIEAEWLTVEPCSKKKCSLLIPQFNESRHANFANRLKYFHNLAEQHEDFVDVILIDDGSSDNSVEIIWNFLSGINSKLHFVCIRPNSQKVGALYLTTLDVQSPYVILSDFDTDIRGLEFLEKYVKMFDADDALLGGYFRMLPFEGKGTIFRFQQLEYALARMLYKFFEKERSVPVMPGAGSIYKRRTLIEIYKLHSGLRSGEDREACMLGKKLGFGTIYLPEILALTRPPLSFTLLVKQRRRWNLGYWETFHKERRFYVSEFLLLTRIGIRTFLDTMTTPIYIILPLVLLIFVFINFKIGILLFILQYLLVVLTNLILVMNAMHEYETESGKYVLTFLIYPVIKSALEFCAWVTVVFYLIRKQMDR